MISRRTFVAAVAASSLTPAFAASPDSIEGELAVIARDCGGRLGVAVLDTTTGRRVALNAGDRFPICSTFKLLAAGAILARVDAGRDTLDRRIIVDADAIVVNSPVTKLHTGGEGLSLASLCEAALTMSDNTAGNLLLQAIGGPDGVTRFARSLGDEVTRLDRIEPLLNEASPGDPRDTTSPAAMLENVRTLCFTDVLTAPSRERLIGWLVANKTGDTRLRAGLPAGWRIGDKTGAGDFGSTNDIAIAWPPERAPVIMAVYLTQTAAETDHRNALIAAVGRAVARIVP